MLPLDMDLGDASPGPPARMAGPLDTEPSPLSPTTTLLYSALS